MHVKASALRCLSTQEACDERDRTKRAIHRRAWTRLHGAPHRVQSLTAAPHPPLQGRAAPCRAMPRVKEERGRNNVRRHGNRATIPSSGVMRADALFLFAGHLRHVVAHRANRQKNESTARNEREHQGGK
eukprot:15444910-Alexandrium_andersonii.AAC.1